MHLCTIYIYIYIVRRWTYTLVTICIGSINTRHDDDDDDDWTCMLDLTTKWVRSFLYGPWPSGSSPCHTHTHCNQKRINQSTDRYIYIGVVFKCYLIKLPILINGFLVSYIYNKYQMIFAFSFSSSVLPVTAAHSNTCAVFLRYRHTCNIINSWFDTQI